MRDEKLMIDRIKNLKHVPKLVHSSEELSTGNDAYYLILQYIEGVELFTKYNVLTDEETFKIGREIAEFLLGLHTIKGDKYDIGHYVPIIPDYDGSWKSGHKKYWESIYKELMNTSLSDSASKILALSNDYMSENISSLDFENGPSLLHNDFHYKNIMVNKGAFSGVIDWECSQYGEADFDLINLLQWGLFPPSGASDMRHLFETVFTHYIKKGSIPKIEKRLTIYALEHDWIQILWSQGKRAEELLPRIEWQLKNLERYIGALWRRL